MGACSEPNSYRCLRVGDGSQPESSRRCCELPVARYEDQLHDCQGCCGGELDRVVGPQGRLFRQVSRSGHQVCCDLDVVEMPAERIETLDGVSQHARRDASRTAGPCQGGTRFHVCDAGSRYPGGLAPNTGGEFGQGLIEQKWDDRRRAKVGDHRRSSMIKGETGAVGVIRLGSGVRSRSRGGVTTPSARIGNSPVTAAVIRA